MPMQCLWQWISAHKGHIETSTDLAAHHKRMINLLQTICCCRPQYQVLLPVHIGLLAARKTILKTTHSSSYFATFVAAGTHVAALRRTTSTSAAAEYLLPGVCPLLSRHSLVLGTVDYTHNNIPDKTMAASDDLPPAVRRCRVSLSA